MIGFQGLLISDDLSMNALEGDLGRRTSSALGSGCDVVLHCNGDMSEMRQVADRSGVLAGRAAVRAAAAVARRGRDIEPLEAAIAEARFARLLNQGRAA